MSDKDDIWFVYILQSEMDKTFYVGISINVDNRIKEHNRDRIIQKAGGHTNSYILN